MRNVKLALFAAFALALAVLPASAASTEIRLGMVLEPPHLDPTAGAAAAIAEIVYLNIFEGLTRIDETATPRPSLATSWTISPDGLTYTFTLKSGVKFHDGTDFDASDVLFSFQRAMAPDSVNAQKAIFEPIENITILDPQTIVMLLKRPTADFLFNIGRSDAVIVAPESAGDNMTHPIGTGPYRFVSWDKGSRAVLEKNPDYQGDGGSLTKATFVFISDPNAATNAMLAGDLDGFPNFPAPEQLDRFAADPRFVVSVGTTEGKTILSTNNKKKPFDDLRVRQAIAHAIDRKAIIDGAMFGYGTPIGSHFPPHSADYVDETATYPFDLDAAKKLLAEAGYPDGFEATLKLPPPTYARRGGQIIASQLAKIGIKLQLINVEWPQWLDEVFTRKDYDLSIVSHVEPNDLGIYADPTYYFQFDNMDFKALMQQINATTSPDGRHALLVYAQDFLSRWAVNGYLFELAQAGVWNANISGYWHNAPVAANDLALMHWDK